MSDPTEQDIERTRLDSWKGIATYLGRDVSTVRRWEREEGLPVHRLVHGKAGSIFAYPHELDDWRRKRTRQGRVGEPAAPGPDERPSESTGVRSTQEPENDLPTRPGAAPPQDVEPTPPPDSAPTVRRRGTLMAAAALLLGVATLGIGWWASARLPSAPRPGIQRIAVLPLRNVSGDPTQDYFADGITEAIIASLGGSGLQVTSKSTIGQLKNTSQTTPAIAAALNVDAILEGAVQRQGDHIRISATLVDGRHNTSIWAREYERDADAVLELQSELARDVAASVGGVAKSAAAPSNRTVPPDVYQRYLKGRYLLGQHTVPAIQQAITEFDQALAADPTFAPAYAGLASAHDSMSNLMLGAPVGPDAADRVMAAAKRALELDPNLAEAHVSLGRSLMARLEWKNAEHELKRALELDPSDVRGTLGLAEWAVAQGDATEAVRLARRARTLDPLSARTGSSVALLLLLAGHKDEAQTMARSIVAERPTYLQGLVVLGSILSNTGQADEAIHYLEQAAGASSRSAGVLAVLARAYVNAGRTQDAQKLLDEVIAQQKRSWVSPHAVAMTYLAVGDREHALDWFERAVRERVRGTHLLSAYMTTYEVFGPLRTDPRFTALVANVMNH